MKRVLAILLTLALCLSLVGSLAYAGEASFADVEKGDYFYNPVRWAVYNSITTGATVTTFNPDDICTRAQAVTFLYRTVRPTFGSVSNPFTDVAEGKYYYNPVLWAVREGITTGMTPTQFGPNQQCTRAQIVTFLWRTVGKPSPTGTGCPFSDVNADDYFYDAVMWAVEKGITTGTNATSFSPDKFCTRGQIVTFLYRYILSCPGPLEIMLHPEDVVASSGDTVQFQVVARGGKAPYTYRWQIAGGSIEGFQDIDIRCDSWASDWSTDTISIEVSDADFIYGYVYRCLVTDANGDFAETYTVRPISRDLFIFEQPQDAVYTGEDGVAHFQVVPDGGTLPWTYQWQYTSDTEQGFINFTSEHEQWATGWNTSRLTVSITEASVNENFRYRCVVTDAEGNQVISSEARAVAP